jgi:hypothetical protein
MQRTRLHFFRKPQKSFFRKPQKSKTAKRISRELRESNQLRKSSDLVPIWHDRGVSESVGAIAHFFAPYIGDWPSYLLR